jgi:tetratricopeptide (TPR) repeat protein
MLKFIFILLNLIFFYNSALADTIYLKSGKVIEANILEDTDDYIKIDFNGNPLYYQKKYIAKIEKAVVVSADTLEVENKLVSAPVVEDYFKKGLEAAVKGDFVAAREELNRGLLKKNASPNINAALDLLDQLDAGKISREYALDLFGGLLNMLVNDYNQAIIYFKRVLEANSSDIDVLYNLGICYYSTNNFKEAIVSFEKILNIKPEDAEVYGLLANAYYLFGDTQKSKECFVLARELFRKMQDNSSAGEIDALLKRLFPQAAVANN